MPKWMPNKSYGGHMAKDHVEYLKQIYIWGLYHCGLAKYMSHI